MPLKPLVKKVLQLDGPLPVAQAALLPWLALLYTHTSGLVCECRQNSLKLLHRLVYCCGCFLQASGGHSSSVKQRGALKGPQQGCRAQRFAARNVCFKACANKLTACRPAGCCYHVNPPEVLAVCAVHPAVVVHWDAMRRLLLHEELHVVVGNEGVCGECTGV